MDSIKKPTKAAIGLAFRQPSESRFARLDGLVLGYPANSNGGSHAVVP